MDNYTTKAEGNVRYDILGNLTFACPFVERPLNVRQTVGAVAYCIMIFLSVVGNILVVLIVYRKQTMRTVTFYLMTNIAVADVIFFVFTGPRQIAEVFTEPSRWLIKGEAGWLSCKFSSFCMDTCQIVSVYSSVAIGINRMAAVCYPNNPRLRGVRARHLIAGVWLLCMLMFVHYFYTFKLVSEIDTNYCRLSLAPRALTTYVILMTFFQYVLPLVMITACYFKVVSRLKKNKLPGSPTAARARRRKHRNRRITKMALAITITFVVLWTPFVIYSYLVVFVWDYRKLCCNIDIRFAVLFVAHSYSMVNPWLCFSFSEKFRQGLKELWTL